MKISVVMGVFNGEKFLKNSIKSILSQTFKDFELIIIDDGSTDNSFEIIKKYARKDKRIRIIKNSQNIGLTKSLNKGIKKAQGDFIARIDVDDISLPNRLEKEVNFLEINPDYAFCGSNVIIKQNINDPRVQFFKSENIRRNLILNNCFIHSTILIRKEIFNKYGFYKESYLYGQDYEFWCRLIYKNKLKAVNLHEKLVIMDIPIKRLTQKDKKTIIQQKNYLKTKLIYLKDNNIIGIFKGSISILKIIIEILLIFFFILVKFQFSKLK